MSLPDRITDAAEQLNRYFGEPRYEEFADALEALAELNDDICHMRSIECCREQANKMKAAIEKIMERYTKEA